MPAQRKAAPKKAAKKAAAAKKSPPAKKATPGKKASPPKATAVDAPAPEPSDAHAGVAHAREVLRHNKEAEHAHRDPRGDQAKMDPKYALAKRDPRKESGIAKTRQVPRLSGMVNWFRRAPKSKSK